MNPSQIRWPAYAYVTDYFGIKVFLFFSKNYLTRIFLFFVATKFHTFSNAAKFRENPYLEINFQSFKLFLLFSGELDNGHYDILDVNNDYIKAYVTNLKKKKRTLKRKMSHDSNVNVPKKKN